MLYIYKHGTGKCMHKVEQIKTMWKKVEPAMEEDAHGQDPDDHLVGNVQRLLEHRG